MWLIMELLGLRIRRLLPVSLFQFDSHITNYLVRKGLETSDHFIDFSSREYL